jgi:hypothetical protein
LDNDLDSLLNGSQLNQLRTLTTPIKIQSFLDETPYSTEDANRTPLQVMQDRLAHCLDGGIFAAAALRRLGYNPMLVDLFPDPGRDDDHVLAIFKVDGYFGALAKSNFTGLRYREPVFRSLRELVASYFESFYNVEGEKTLRTYTRPLNLIRFDHLNWLQNKAGVDAIEDKLLSLPRIPLLTPAVIQFLSPVDSLSYKAGMLGTNPAGLYKPH